MLGMAGCSFQPSKQTVGAIEDASHYKHVALEMEYPKEPVPERQDDFAAFAPHVIREGPPEYWDLKLEEALQLALMNSPVLRDLGGQVLTNPQIVRTIQGPAITETDPNIGVEAALSQFDADFSATGNWQNNHRAINNAFFGGGTRLFQQDLNQYQVQLAKRAATGGQYFLRQNTIYDANNAPANLFPSAWDTMIEAEVRQPLLQGAGTLYNRIAGPNGTIGVAQGVLIARVNTDISLADFELGVRNLISNVENAYWDLYFAYRDLNAKIVARDSALETWRRIHALYVTGRRGGEADKEAQARDQYYYFQAEVEDALTGRLFDGTRTNNGSSGGTFRANPGVYVTERRLRLTMGLRPNDKRLIRPAEEPLQARVAFDWDHLTTEAITRRAELRRQRAFVKRRELELIAARNFLLPRLDTDALYRWRGLGHTLIGYGDNPEFSNAYQTLFGGQFQEWQLGATFDMPLGFRQGHAAVRNAQLVLSRERAILREQELQVVHDLSNVVGDVDRAYIVSQTNYNRRMAAAQQMAAVQTAFEADTASLLDLVESQRRLADADSRYARSMVEYTLAVKNVMFESNTLLENNGINMAEGPWPGKAYHDAAKRDSLRSRPLRLSYILPQGPLVSTGQYAQQQLPPAVVVGGNGATPGTPAANGAVPPAGAAPGAAPHPVDGNGPFIPGQPVLPGSRGANVPPSARPPRPGAPAPQVAGGASLSAGPMSGTTPVTPVVRAIAQPAYISPAARAASGPAGPAIVPQLMPPTEPRTIPQSVPTAPAVPQVDPSSNAAGRVQNVTLLAPMSAPIPCAVPVPQRTSMNAAASAAYAFPPTVQTSVAPTQPPSIQLPPAPTPPPGSLDVQRFTP
jgi:hypothetical protein